MNVNTRGWYSLRVFFSILEVQQNHEGRFARCIDETGDEFYLEITPDLTKKLFSSSYFTSTFGVSAEDMAIKIRTTTCIYSVGFLNNDGNEEIIAGYTIEKDDLFGRTLVVSLDNKNLSENAIKCINNKDIQYLILNDVKYVVE